MEAAIPPVSDQSSYGYPRPFLLSHFCVEAPLREVRIQDRIFFAHKPVLRQTAALLRRAFGVREFTESIEQRFTFLHDLPIDPSLRTLYLTGYWQTYRLVAAVEGKLRREFQLKTPASGKNLQVMEQIKACAAPVSLHIRRGDYTVASEAMKPLSMDFYKQAIALLQNRLDHPVFFVFSDDIEFSRASLSAGVKAVFVDHNDSFTSHEDLRLMSSCSHHIIANSTFSWWGAWLNPRPDKIVVCPRNWLAGSHYPELFAPDWIVLDA